MIRSLVLALTLALALPAAAQIEVGDSVTTQATIASIDPATRTIELKREDGKLVSFVDEKKVVDLEKLKVGDVVTATYAVAIAAELVKPGETAPPAAVSAAKSAPGEMMGARQVTATLKVEAVDAEKNTVTLTGPKGNTRTVHVKRPEVQAKLKDLKAGDEVQVTYTEAMALSVTPAPK